jgi:YgiT-type zinc finger domain-containing protein
MSDHIADRSRLGAGPHSGNKVDRGLTRFSGCPRCGSGPLKPSMVSSVFWRGDNALMIRNIPAFVCMACGEDFINDETVIELDRIKGLGFDGANAESYARIPVFTLGAQKSAAGN